MSYGGWREEKDLAADADTAFEHLLGLLQHLGLEIESADPALRGVTAMKPFIWWWEIMWLAIGTSRIAAAIDPAGPTRSRIVIESAPAYRPLMSGERVHRKNVGYILNLLDRSLAS
ncbi:hypothetical protein [Bauldia litoralis]|uniref:hypothetical protein n=1 Tax=Bauldia litoralis TaxID=665467 RepID=UPI0032676442